VHYSTPKQRFLQASSFPAPLRFRRRCHTSWRPNYISSVNVHLQYRLQRHYPWHFEGSLYYVEKTIEDWCSESCGDQDPIVLAIHVFSHAVVIWFVFYLSRTPADEDRWQHFGVGMEEGYSREQLQGGFIGAAVLEAVRSYDAALGFWLWHRSCSWREAEALLFVFVDLLMLKLQLYRD